MNLTQLSRRDFLLLTLQLLAASQLPGCRSSQPVLGRAPVGSPLMAEDHSEALAHWAAKGIRDAVLINIDTHDDMRWAPETKIEALRQIYRNGDRQRFREVAGLGDNSLYHIGNWIYAGGRLGMFREVYWVIPFDVLSMNNPDAGMRRFMQDYEFTDEEIRSFSLRGRQFRGTFHGVPLTVCDIRSLPDISSPLLLSIDTDFFPPYSTVHEKSYLPSLHELFTALYAKRYRILDAVVSYSVNGDFLPPHLRWVGDTVGMILEKPGLIDEVPSELLTLLQQVDNDYRGTDATAMLAYIAHWEAAYPVPALEAYRALAHTLRNDPESAYRAAVKSCTMDRNYCTLLPYIGTYYYSKGSFATAERFFLAGFDAAPRMANGLFQYAHCLRQTGRVKEAITWYEKDEAVNGLFPTRFLIAEMHLLLGDGKAAAASIAAAVEGLLKNRYADVVNDETARAIYAALDFCDRQGLRDLAGALRANPAVTRMFAAYPKKDV
jgi:tetratricopeptide (TPR) repeat protein